MALHRGPRRAPPGGERRRGGGREACLVGQDERSGACGDEGGGSDLLKLDDALASVDDFVAEKLK